MAFEVILKPKITRYYNGKTIIKFSRIPFPAVLPINLVLYSKNWKSSIIRNISIKILNTKPYIGRTKSKSSASSIVVPISFVTN